MSKSLMSQLKKDLANSRPCHLSRQNVERVKETIPDVMFCVSCNEQLPKGHHIGDRDINGLWEPFCQECFEVTTSIRKWAEKNDDDR